MNTMHSNTMKIQVLRLRTENSSVWSEQMIIVVITNLSFPRKFYIMHKSDGGSLLSTIYIVYLDIEWYELRNESHLLMSRKSLLLKSVLSSINSNISLTFINFCCFDAVVFLFQFFSAYYSHIQHTIRFYNEWESK